MSMINKPMNYLMKMSSKDNKEINIQEGIFLIRHCFCMIELLEFRSCMSRKS